MVNKATALLQLAEDKTAKLFVSPLALSPCKLLVEKDESKEDSLIPGSQMEQLMCGAMSSQCDGTLSRQAMMCLLLCQYHTPASCRACSIWLPEEGP